MTKVQKFRHLHSQEKPLLIGNVWNVQSAKIYEKLNFQAIATSSAAIAHSLGYNDGEEMSFSEYLFMIKRILKSTHLPLSVDLEAGYGKTTEEIFENIFKLSQLGVVGINLEDSIVVNKERNLVHKEIFTKKLKNLTLKLKEKQVDIFLNIRTDTFLLGVENVLEETITRINLWEKLKIDGIFVPCITKEKDIEIVVNATQLPTNVMAMPELPNFDTLKKLGAKRISSGNFLNDKIYGNLEREIKTIAQNQNFNSLFYV